MLIRTMLRITDRDNDVGAVKESDRTIWQMGRIELRDAGPNGTGYGVGCPQACGDGDEAVFMRQGVFVP